MAGFNSSLVSCPDLPASHEAVSDVAGVIVIPGDRTLVVNAHGQGVGRSDGIEACNGAVAHAQEAVKQVVRIAIRPDDNAFVVDPERRSVRRPWRIKTRDHAVR